MPRHVQMISPFTGSNLTSDVVNLENTRGWSYSVRTLAAGTSGITLQLSIDNSNWSVNAGYHQIAFDLETGPANMPFARFLRNSAVTVTADVNMVER
jgi:hypothetical protein